MKFASHITKCARQTHTLTRTLSMLLVCAAATSSSAATVKALTWDTVDASCTQQTTMVCVDYPMSATWAASEMKKLPVGKKAMLLRWFVNDMAEHLLDRCVATDAKGQKKITQYQSPWLTNGIKRSQARIEKFFDEFKAAGGTVDYVIFDNETCLTAWELGMDGLKAIENDSRFKTTFAKSLGFQVSQIKWDNIYHSRWDAYMAGVIDAGMNAAAFTPIQKRFPKARVSNYHSMVLKQANAVPNILGVPLWSQSSGFGTDDAPSYYGQSTVTMAAAKFDGVNAIGSKPEDQFRFQLNRMRSVITSGGRSQMPWIAHRQFGKLANWGPFECPMSSTKYWDEMVIQQVMHGTDTILVFNPNAWPAGSDPKLFNPKEDQFALESIITDLNARLGANPGASRWFTVTGWADKVFATGRILSNGTLWRISFTDDVNSIALPLKDGTIQIVTRQEGTAGAWFFETLINPITVREDNSEVAFVVVDASIIQADINGDSKIDSADMTQLVASMGKKRMLQADLNQDGRVDQADQSQLTFIQTNLKSLAKISKKGTTPVMQVSTQLALK